MVFKKAMKFNDIVIVSIKGNGYKIHNYNMGKDDGCNKHNEKL